MPPVFVGNFVGTDNTALSTRGYSASGAGTWSATIQSNEGRLRYSGSGSWAGITPTISPILDGDVLVRVRSDGVNGSGLFIEVRGYAVYLVSNNRDLEVYRTDTWALIDDAANFLPTNPTTACWVRFQVEGTALRAKAWAGAVGDEPVGWGWTGTDSALTTPTATEVVGERWTGSTQSDWFVLNHEVTDLAAPPATTISAIPVEGIGFVASPQVETPIDATVGVSAVVGSATVPECDVTVVPFEWPFIADFDYPDDTELSDIGFTVVHQISSTGSATVQDGKAVIANGGETWLRVLPDHPPTDITEMLVRFSTPVSGASTRIRIRTDPDTGSGYALLFYGSSGPQINLRRQFNWSTSGTENILDSVVRTWDVGDEVFVRFRADGDNIRARIWAVEDPEPSEWLLEANDDTWTDGVTAIVHSTDEADASSIEISVLEVHNTISETIGTAPVVGVGTVPEESVLAGSGETVSAETFVGVGQVNEPSISVGYVLSPDSVVGGGFIPEADVTIGVVVSCETVVGSGLVPEPTIFTSSTVLPVSVVGSSVVPDASVLSDLTVLPVSVVGAGVVPDHVLSGGVGVLSDSVEGVAHVDDPALTAGADIVCDDAGFAGHVGVPDVSGGTGIQVPSVTSTSDVPQVGISNGHTINAVSSVIGDGFVTVVSVAAGGGVAAVADPVDGLGLVPEGIVTAGSTGTHDSVTGVGHVGEASISIGVHVPVASVEGVGTVPDVSVDAVSGVALSADPVSGSSHVGEVAFSGSATIRPSEMVAPVIVEGVVVAGSVAVGQDELFGVGLVPEGVVSSDGSVSAPVAVGVGWVIDPLVTGDDQSADAWIVPGLLWGVAEFPRVVIVGPARRLIRTGSVEPRGDVSSRGRKDRVVSREAGNTVGTREPGN